MHFIRVSPCPPCWALACVVGLVLLCGRAAWAQTAVPPPARVAALGTYQQEALQKALAARNLEVDPNPTGKRVAGIWVKNLDVFGPEDSALLTWLNVFHMTTRETIIAREVLLRPGDVWSDDIAEETRRRLMDPLFTSYVVVMPVRAVNPNEVFVLVVTRDLFSLRLNTDFEYQAGVFSLLRIEPAENNFLGRRKRVAGVFEMDLGRFSVGPTYYDSNIWGSRWQLSSAVRAMFARETSEYEGTASETKLEYPLWSFARKWSFVTTFTHFNGPQRSFLGPDLRTYDDKATPDEETLPWRYRYRRVGTSTSVVRQYGTTVLQRFGAGYSFNVRRPGVFEEDFATTAPDVRAAFMRDVLPRSERVSSPFISYVVFTPRFVTFRDVETFDLPEDRSLGPSLILYLGWSEPALGSGRRFLDLSGTLAFDAEIGHRGLLRLSASGSGRADVHNNDLYDARWSTNAFFATPQVGNVARLVVRLGSERLIDNQSVRNVAIGGDSGLRGYPINAFFGPTLVRGNVELRSAPLRVAFARLGLAAFWDFGHAAPRFADLVIRHDFGMGFRLLLPQLQPTVIRFDWAVATQGPTAGLPGRFTAGFTQAF